MSSFFVGRGVKDGEVCFCGVGDEVDVVEIVNERGKFMCALFVVLRL